MLSASLYRDPAVDVHYPDARCQCAAGPVYDFQLREFC